MLWCTLQCRFSVVPPYSSFAEKIDIEFSEYAEIQICVDWGTSWLLITQMLFPEPVIVSVKYFNDGVTFLNAGVCKDIAGVSQPYFYDGLWYILFSLTDFYL